MKLRASLSAIAGAVALALALPAVAGPLEDGIEAYREQDYEKALELWKPLAEQGNVTAQYQLGTLYAEGKGVEQSDTTAAAWFARAANQGNATAQYNLAASYAEGLGVPKDDATAFRWFRRAAEQGMPYAELNLGIMYTTQRGVQTADYVEAVKWLELAVYALPPGGARSDAARMLKEAADKLTEEQLLEARSRVKAFRPKPETK